MPRLHARAVYFLRVARSYMTVYICVGILPYILEKFYYIIIKTHHVVYLHNHAEQRNSSRTARGRLVLELLNCPISVHIGHSWCVCRGKKQVDVCWRITVQGCIQCWSTRLHCDPWNAEVVGIGVKVPVIPW